MWECSKCGHKSGTRRASSYGCNHNWWDENELATARARQQEEDNAEIQRKIFEFNDWLLNSEEGLKLSGGEKGWDWLIDRSSHYGSSSPCVHDMMRKMILEDRGGTRISIDWRDSTFGTTWFFSEHGQQYLNYVQGIIIQACSNVVNFKFDNYWDGRIYFGKLWFETEQGIQYMNNLQVLLKEKEAESQKYAWLWVIIFFIAIPFAYFLLTIHLLVKDNGYWWFIMFCLAAIAWFATIIKKEFWLTIWLPILFVLSALFYKNVIQ